VPLRLAETTRDVLTTSTPSRTPTLTALATSLALALAAVAGAVLVQRASGGFAPPKSLVRTVIATAVAVGVGTFMPWWGHAVVPVQAVVVVLVYLGIAIALGELTRADLATVRAVLGKKRG